MNVTYNWVSTTDITYTGVNHNWREGKSDNTKLTTKKQSRFFLARSLVVSYSLEPLRLLILAYVSFC